MLTCTSNTVETGEEEETTHYQCRGKLFHFDGEWKERGVGVLRINGRVHTDEEEQRDSSDEARSKVSARLVMRAESVWRVILNTPIFKGIKVGGPAGEEPTNNYIHLSGIYNNKPVPLLIRVCLCPIIYISFIYIDIIYSRSGVSNKQKASTKLLKR